MATYSQLSDYDSSPWQPDTFKARESKLSSPPTSIHYTKDVSITNGSQSEVFEETFKSTLKVTSDSSSPLHVEDTDSKLSTTLASFMDKIRYLEKQREILEDRWAMLQVEENSQKDLEPIYLSYISRLLGQVNRVTQKNHHTQFNLLDMMDSVKDNKNNCATPYKLDPFMDSLASLERSSSIPGSHLPSIYISIFSSSLTAAIIPFEGELFLHTQLEYSFVDMKKDVDTCSLDRTELEIKRRELKGLIELMKSVYEQELKELIEETGDISVLVNMDSSCHLDLESIVEEVKERYESIAARSRKEAQALSKSKLQQGALRAGHCEVELENSRTQISQMNSKIQRMRSEILSVQNQCIHQEQEVSKAKTKSSTALKDANVKLEEVQEALQKAKQDIACQMREYQELMNVKLALDIEIVTYKKLLEGEESRLQAPPSVVNVHVESEVRKPAPSRFKRSSSSKSLQSSSSDY